MSSRAEILGTLQEIRDQMRSLTPSYDTEFEEFALADTVRDWDYAAQPVFTSTELLELETIYQRLRLRWVERSNALKERMMAQMVQEYLQVIRKAERRHRRLQQEEAESNDESMETGNEDDAFGSPKADETPLEDETPEDAWEPDAVPSQQPTRAEPDPVPEPTQSAVQTPEPTPTDATNATDGPGNANRTGRNRSNRT